MLDLVGSEHQRLGSFLLYKEYSEKPLLIDVNLITVEFKKSLAAAVQRLFARQVDPRAAGASAGAGNALFS